MTSLQITTCWPTINPLSIFQPCLQPSMQCFSQIHTMNFSGPSLKLAISTSTYQQCKPMCLFGGKGKGKSENDNEDSPWKALENAMGSFRKEKSVDEVLRQQIEKQEYYDDGGSMGYPPYGGGGDDSGGGDGSGGSDNEGLDGFWDELLQVTLATFGFIFLYIYIINGEELTLLARDYIKYLFGGSMSIRLRRTVFKWRRFWKKIMRETAVADDPYWLEREIINTPTWWDSPEKYRRILGRYSQSTSNQ